MRKAITTPFWAGLVLACTPAFLHGQSNTAQLTGGITDSSGGAVEQAEVTISNIETGARRGATNIAGARGSAAPAAGGQRRAAR